MVRILLLLNLFFGGYIFSDIDIAGGEAYLDGKWKVIKDIQINELRIRHLRQTKGQDSRLCVSGNYDVVDLVGPINPDTSDVIERILSSSNNRCIIKSKMTLQECVDDGTTLWLCKRAIKDKNHLMIPMMIYMSSGGGYLKSGFDLGEILRNHYTWTLIPWNSTCASSCATAFLGGNIRRMEKGSSILFHAPYNYGLSKSYTKPAVICHEENYILKEYMIFMLGKKDGQRVYKRTMDFCSPNGGWQLNPDAGFIYNINMFE